VAKPEDFVVIKLDIDHTQLELAIIHTILNVPEIRELVDEVYFEYHFWLEFNFGALQPPPLLFAHRTE
jgi:hypothetical protein